MPQSYSHFRFRIVSSPHPRPMRNNNLLQAKALLLDSPASSTPAIRLLHHLYLYSPISKEAMAALSHIPFPYHLFSYVLLLSETLWHTCTYIRLHTYYDCSKPLTTSASLGPDDMTKSVISTLANWFNCSEKPCFI